jgi:regulatory protein
MESEKNKVMEKALSLLSIRAHSRKELQEKLMKKDFSYRDVDYALAECERLNLINDVQFAQVYSAELRGRGYGAFRVRNALYKKGIPRDIIDSTMAELAEDKENDEKILGREVMRNKLRLLRRERDFQKKRQKIYRFMVSRGFPSAIIQELLDDLSEEIDHDRNSDY